jgi:DNA-binding NarL/FixJ family response regulator
MPAFPSVSRKDLKDKTVNETVRILIVDDHQIFRDGLKLLLESAAENSVVGEAETGAEAVRLAGELKPDVILMDLQMPEIDGIEATRQILQRLPEAKILILTMFDDDQSVFAAMRAGALGYILKGVKRDKMLRAVEAVASGEAIFSADIATRMIEFFTQLHAPASPAAFPELTEREREILSYLARSYKNSEIAEALVISSKTVRNHVSNILSKLQAESREAAARQARNAGLG